MSKHKLIINTGVYFITFTCHKWFHLIELTQSYTAVYKFFDTLKTKNHSLLSYVIMPNHIHFLVYYQGGGRSLNIEIGSGKRFIAYDIINQLKKSGQQDLLHQLSLAVKPKDRMRGKKHEVWIDSFDVKHCRTEKFILQKLNYIHNNPCVGKWKLAKRPAEYPWSSAAFYEGEKTGYPVKDYLDILALLEKD